MKRRFFLITLLLLTGWIVTDLFIPRHTNLRQFDPAEVARLDAAMWRSYYERRPLRLFWQTTELARQQLHAPFWRSVQIAFHAAKAAFVFKGGKSRADYARALPDLEAFYGTIADLSSHRIDVARAARNELEWWIIRRDRKRHPPGEWVTLQARVMADLYDIPETACRPYAQARTRAMLLRDERADAITEADWQQVQRLLEQSWQSLAQAVQRPAGSPTSAP